MANQGYLGHKTHPTRARATDKARAFSFYTVCPSLYVLLPLSLSSFAPSLSLCLSLSAYYPSSYAPSASKVHRAGLLHYGIKAVGCTNTHTHQQHVGGCECVLCECVCVCVVTDVLYRLKICVTDNCGRQMASLNGIGQLTSRHQQIS